MKKTLIALAAIAATSASFAQVTITGEYAYGWKQSSTDAMSGTKGQTAKGLIGGTGGNTTGDSAGLGVDTATVTFASKEDLGGGYAAEASINIDTIVRGTVAGGDTSLKLTTPVGLITLQSYKPADYLSEGLSGVGGVTMEDKVFSARSLKDSAGFTTKLGPVYLGYSLSEQGTATNAPSDGTAANVGLGVGSQGAASAVGQRVSSYSATYVGGALKANLNYLSYDNQKKSDVSSNTVIRTALSYDLGALTLGAGYSQAEQTSGAKIRDAILAVSVPMGSFTLGANYAIQTLADTTILGAGVADGSRNGYSLKGVYSLSKRTYFSASYANWSPVDTATQRNSQTVFLLGHTF